MGERLLNQPVKGPLGYGNRNNAEHAYKKNAVKEIALIFSGRFKASIYRQETTLWIISFFSTTVMRQ